MTEDEDDKDEDEEEDEDEDEGDNDGDELLISTCFKRGCCGSIVGPIGDSISICLPMITLGEEVSHWRSWTHGRQHYLRQPACFSKLQLMCCQGRKLPWLPCVPKPHQMSKYYYIK